MRVAAFIIIAIAAACSRGTAPAGKEAPVITFEVKTTADLQKAASEYMRLAKPGTPSRVEINVSPGATIDTAGWSLEPELGASREVPIDVVIRGGGNAVPLFRTIVARSVVIEDVVLTEGKRGELHATGDVVLRRVSLVDGRRVSPRSGDVKSPDRGLLEITAGGNVTLEDAWFVRNFQDEQPDHLLRIAGEHVRLVRAAFLGNAFAADLAITRATKVELDDSVFYRSWDGAGTELACDRCGPVVVTGSSFVLERVDQVAATPVQLHDSPVVTGFAKKGELGSLVASLTTKPVLAPTHERWSAIRALFPR